MFKNPEENVCDTNVNKGEEQFQYLTTEEINMLKKYNEEIIISIDNIDKIKAKCTHRYKDGHIAISKDNDMCTCNICGESFHLLKAADISLDIRNAVDSIKDIIQTIKIHGASIIPEYIMMDYLQILPAINKLSDLYKACMINITSSDANTEDKVIDDSVIREFKCRENSINENDRITESDNDNKIFTEPDIVEEDKIKEEGMVYSINESDNSISSSISKNKYSNDDKIFAINNTLEKISEKFNITMSAAKSLKTRSQKRFDSGKLK